MTYRPSLYTEEKIASLFQPDPVLPAEYFETFRRKMPFLPEQRLIFAILEDGIMCFQKYALARSSTGKRLFGEAENWILGDDADSLFSFENVCSGLGLDPDYLREGLTRGREKLLSPALGPKGERAMKKTRKKRKYRFAA
jgi:hypothetical protein